MTTYDQAIGYDAAISYDGGTVDLTPSRNLRFEVAFATSPDDPAPAWVDLSDRVHLPSGITVRRGRADEFSTPQTGTLNIALENIDGALSPDNTSSPYYPNVLPRRRCRLTYRNPSTYGTRNLIAAPDASFETLPLTWQQAGGATIAQDSTHVDVGTQALVITWPTAGPAASHGNVTVTGLAIGRRYTARARVWSATGVPDVQLRVGGVGGGAATSVKNAWADITYSWVATSGSHLIYVGTATASTAGQQTWVDAVMLDETPVGTTLGPFTTLPATGDDGVVLSRFDGYVDRWPIAWPDGGQTYARSEIVANDLLARLGDRQKLRSVVVETMALDSPTAHFPLGEPADSTSVSSVDDGISPVTLAARQLGTGGTVAFAEGTGVPTDGIGAPIFTPASSSDGIRLIGRGFPLNAGASQSVSMAASIASKATSGTAASMFDDYGAAVSIELDGSGRVVGRFAVPLLGVNIAATSPSAYNDGQSASAAVALATSGGLTTIDLTVNGVLVATANTSSAALPVFSGVSIGGSSTGNLFTGTISHVAVFPAYLTTYRLAQHDAAQRTGFAGESSDQRLARVATWIGLPAERCNFDAGISTSVGHIDTTGLDPLTYLRKIEATEAGLLFAGTDGRLTFHNRARSYANTAPALSIPTDMLDPGTAMAKDLQLVTNIVTGQRQGGATVRMVDQASVDAYDPLEDTLDVVTTSDDDVAAAVGWRLNTSSEPLTRFTDLVLDAYTDTTYSPQIRQAVDIDTRVEITGMPSQAPASTLRQTVQGYTESISDSSWSLSVNATPYAHLIALVLDDPVLGALDSYPLAY